MQRHRELHKYFLFMFQNHAGKETFIVSRAPPNGDDLPQHMLNVILNKNIKTIINLHIGKGKGDQATVSEYSDLCYLFDMFVLIHICHCM